MYKHLNMKKIILKNFQSPGDIVMLTAAIRDLHRCYPHQFLTDIRTSSPQLWQHNPNITSFSANEDDVKIIDCHYPLIHHSNTRPYHFIHGFIDYLNDQLGTAIKPTAFKGDIHLTDTEKADVSFLEQHGIKDGYWLMVSGGKTDFTIKWWSPKRYQQVVDYFNI
jgi:ADP-heptose:LPS heptosyltransferase